jgi:hypothetical protein
LFRYAWDYCFKLIAIKNRKYMIKINILLQHIAILLLASGFLAAGYSCGKDGDDDGKEGELTFTHEGHSYRIVKQTKTWAEAAADAVSLGGYLAEIESKAEQEAIQRAIQQSGISPSYTKVADGGGIGYIWIGATDGMTSEGTWIWNGARKSGTFSVFWIGNNKGGAIAGSYVNWGGTADGKLNEPDNFTDSGVSPKGQNAAAIGLANWPSGSSSPLGRAGEWNDIAETNKIYYLVEFDSTK